MLFFKQKKTWGIEKGSDVFPVAQLLGGGKYIPTFAAKA